MTKINKNYLIHSHQDNIISFYYPPSYDHDQLPFVILDRKVMAPDLNTVPSSPRNGRRTSTSRISEPMAPPPAPIATLSSQNLRENAASSMSSTTGDNTGVGVGPGTDS